MIFHNRFCKLKNTNLRFTGDGSATRVILTSKTEGLRGSQDQQPSSHLKILFLIHCDIVNLILLPSSSS